MDYRIKARKTIIRRDRCCGFPPGSQSISHSISERRWRDADYTEFISIEVRHARMTGGGFSLCGGGARATSSARLLNHRKQTRMCARAQLHLLLLHVVSLGSTISEYQFLYFNLIRLLELFYFRVYLHLAKTSHRT